MKQTIQTILDKLNLLSDSRLSITNLLVYMFSLIVAFKLLFAGANIKLNNINWTVEQVDINSSLPLLFSLLNYSHKRLINSTTTSTSSDTSSTKQGE